MSKITDEQFGRATRILAAAKTLATDVEEGSKAVARVTMDRPDEDVEKFVNLMLAMADEFRGAIYATLKPKYPHVPPPPPAREEYKRRVALVPTSFDKALEKEVGGLLAVLKGL